MKPNEKRRKVERLLGIFSPQTLQLLGLTQPAIAPLAMAAPVVSRIATQPKLQGDYTSLVVDASRKYGLPNNLLRSLITQESGFNPRAVSPVGAIGIAQFMPQTAKGMGVNPWDPQSSIYGAARLLNEEYGRFGSWPYALAAYNAGPGAVKRYGGIPPFPETQNYVKRIMAMSGGV